MNLNLVKVNMKLNFGIVQCLTQFNKNLLRLTYFFKKRFIILREILGNHYALSSLVLQERQTINEPFRLSHEESVHPFLNKVRQGLSIDDRLIGLLFLYFANSTFGQSVDKL